jgi:hypothetical protein
MIFSLSQSKDKNPSGCSSPAIRFLMGLSAPKDEKLKTHADCTGILLSWSGQQLYHLYRFSHHAAAAHWAAFTNPNGVFTRAYRYHTWPEVGITYRYARPCKHSTTLTRGRGKRPRQENVFVKPFFWRFRTCRSTWSHFKQITCSRQRDDVSCKSFSEPLI